MNEPHPVRWKSMVGLGMVSILLGLFMLLSVNTATQMIAMLTGIIIILLSGIFLIEGLFIDTEGWTRWGIIVLGVLGFLLGAAAVAVPSLLVVSTGLVLGIFLLIYGIGETAVGIGVVFAESMVRMVFIMLGIFSMIVGLLLILNPTLGIDILVWLTGLYLLVLGLMRVARGLNEREAEGKVAVKRL
jgi:uncharacterized membrane protein HdeD (DUF308 family)